MPCDVHAQGERESQFPADGVQGKPDGPVPAVDGFFQRPVVPEYEVFRQQIENEPVVQFPRLRTFIPQGKSLYEVIEITPENNLLVKWHRKKNPMGKKGAYDQLVHGSSTQSLDPEYYSPSLSKRGGEEVMHTISENKYGLIMNGKFRTFMDKRSFLKLFPDRKDALETAIDEQHLLFSDFEDVVTLVKIAVQP